MIRKFLFLALLIVSFASCRSKKIDPLKNNEVEGILKSKKKSYSYSKTLSDKDKQYFADALEVDVAEITNKKLYIFIKSWEETTYLYGGEDKNGIDCSALMQELFKYVYKENLPRTSGEMFVDRKFKPLKENELLEEGDLVFFKIDQTKKVSHVGIYLKNSKFYSASSTEGCSISDINNNYWKKYYIGASRLKK